MNSNLIDSTVLIPELTATERDLALDEVLGAVVDAGVLDAGARKEVLKQLLAREAQGSTGLGNGVAVPHVKEADVAEIAVAVAINEAGIGFDAIDGRPVHIMFVVLGPKGGQPEQHLAALRWVSTLARNADFRRFALHVKSAEELRDLLLEMTGIA
jgi:mannitol/fructose-specific phosphotransferase system IIA component (Ntr-type)